MNRITVTFPDDVMKKLNIRKKDNSLNSVSQCVRELVELGLNIEKFNQGKEEEFASSSEELKTMLEIKNLIQNNLNWALETRLLSRYIVEQMPSSDPNLNLKILKQYKEKATDYVTELLDDNS